MEFCGPDRSRTGDLSHAMRTLCQLSYRPADLYPDVVLSLYARRALPLLFYYKFSTKKMSEDFISKEDPTPLLIQFGCVDFVPELAQTLTGNGIALCQAK